MLTSVHTPNNPTTTPQALGLTPTLSIPSNLGIRPNNMTKDLTINTDNPAQIEKPNNKNGENMAPVILDLATAPTP